MNLRISYIELADLLNDHVARKYRTEDMVFIFIPLPDGIEVKFEKMHYSMFNLKDSLYVKIVDFKDDILNLSVVFDNSIYDFLKKVMFVTAMNYFKEKLNPNEQTDIAEFIDFSANDVFVVVNGVLKTLKQPVLVRNIIPDGDGIVLDFFMYKIKEAQVV